MLTVARGRELIHNEDMRKVAYLLISLVLLPLNSSAERYDELKAALLDRPDNRTTLSDVRTSIPKIEDKDQRNELIVLYAMGTRFAGVTAEADKMDAYVRKSLATDKHALLMDPALIHAPCGACNRTGFLNPTCQNCEGSGKCPRCDGTGKQSRKGFEEVREVNCMHCKSTGDCKGCRGAGVLSKMCAACKGRGSFPDQERLKDVYIGLLSDDLSGLDLWYPLRLTAEGVTDDEQRAELFTFRNDISEMMRDKPAHELISVAEKISSQHGEISKRRIRKTQAKLHASWQAQLKGVKDLERQVRDIARDRVKYENRGSFDSGEGHCAYERFQEGAAGAGPTHATTSRPEGSRATDGISSFQDGWDAGSH